MARLSAVAKVQRVVEFLLGLRDERVLAALVGCGFTQRERAEGWQLLQTLGMTDTAREVRHDDEPVLQKLDAWHNQWIRIAKVSLQRGFPRVYDQIIPSVGNVSHASVIVVPVFLRNFEKLTRAKDTESKAALAKLRQRGLTPERIAEGQQLAAQFMKLNVSTTPAPDLRKRRAAIEQAEAALWDYYLEWSQLARTVIKDVRLLKLLGFRGGTVDDVQTEPVLPVVAPTPEVKAHAQPATRAVQPRKPARGKKARKRAR
jgi:hypothetical protein